MDNNSPDVWDRNDKMIWKYIITIGNIKFVYRQAFLLAVWTFSYNTSMVVGYGCQGSQKHNCHVRISVTFY